MTVLQSQLVTRVLNQLKLYANDTVLALLVDGIEFVDLIFEPLDTFSTKFRRIIVRE